MGTLFAGNGSTRMLKLCLQLFGAAGGLCVLAGMAGLFRNRLSYHALRFALAITCLTVAVYVYAVWQAAYAILGAGLEINGDKQDNATILMFIWDAAWPALAVALYAAWLLVLLRSRSVCAAFTGETGGPLQRRLPVREPAQPRPRPPPSPQHLRQRPDPPHRHHPHSRGC